MHLLRERSLIIFQFYHMQRNCLKLVEKISLRICNSNMSIFVDIMCMEISQVWPKPIFIYMIWASKWQRLLKRHFLSYSCIPESGPRREPCLCSIDRRSDHFPFDNSMIGWFRHVSCSADDGCLKLLTVISMNSCQCIWKMVWPTVRFSPVFLNSGWFQDFWNNLSSGLGPDFTVTLPLTFLPQAR